MLLSKPEKLVSSDVGGGEHGLCFLAPLSPPRRDTVAGIKILMVSTLRRSKANRPAGPPTMPPLSPRAVSDMGGGRLMGVRGLLG